MGERVRFSARVEPGLLDLLKASAVSEGRSVNGQLEVFLRECLRARGIAAPADRGKDGGAT